MAALLMMLYVMTQNGWVVPSWCFIAAWVLTLCKIIATAVTELIKGGA